jgi:hypothetical protein
VAVIGWRSSRPFVEKSRHLVSTNGRVEFILGVGRCGGVRMRSQAFFLLSMIIAVAPATAAQRPATARQVPACSHEKARAASCASTSSGGGVFRFWLFNWLPSDGFSIRLGRASGPFAP